MQNEDVIAVDVEQAAKMVSADKRVIVELIERGELPALSLGRGERRYFRVQIDDLRGLFKRQTAVA